MTNLKKFSTGELTRSSDMNDNFNVVKTNITNIACRLSSDLTYTTLFSGDVNMQNKSITGLNEDKDLKSATILRQLPNHYKIVSTPSPVLFGDYKTLLVTNTIRNGVFNINVDPLQNNYTYTIITDFISSVVDCQLAINDITQSGTINIPPNCTLSFLVVVAEGDYVVYKCNNSNNYNLPIPDKQIQVFDSGELTVSNSDIVIPYTSNITKYNILNLQVYATFTFTSSASVSFIRINDTYTGEFASSFSVESISTNNPSTESNLVPNPIKTKNYNSTRNMLASTSKDLYLTCDFFDNSDIIYKGFSINPSGYFNIFSGVKPISNFNVLNIDYINKTLANTTQLNNNYMFNITAPSQTFTSATYRYYITYEQ